MHILIIEDEAPLRELICDILVDVGYTVEMAGDGAEALALIDGTVPDIVIADLRLPNLDGCGFTRAFRKKYGPGIPIIIMSAAYQKHQIDCLNQANAFLEKPFSINELLHTIRSIRASP